MSIQTYPPSRILPCSAAGLFPLPEEVMGWRQAVKGALLRPRFSRMNRASNG
jgi:hypothetical protein